MHHLLQKFHLLKYIHLKSICTRNLSNYPFKIWIIISIKDSYINEPCSVKRGLNAFMKSIQNFSLSVNFHNVIGCSTSRFSLLFDKTKYTEPKKKLSRDLNGTISTFAFINSFYSYLLLHND